MGKRTDYNLKIGGVITLFMALLIVVGFFYTPYDPNGINAAVKSRPPSFEHLLGTDNMGRDIFSRILEGMGSTFFIAVCTVAIGAFFGIILGAVTGYWGGWADEVLMRFCDVVAAFPSILLALVIISILGSGKYNIIIALGILFIPSFARIVRGEFARFRERDYVKSARLMGASHIRIMAAHILPNAMPMLLSAAAVGFNNAVLAEASMSYLGIGVQPPDPSLGRMLSEAQAYLFSSPWYALSVGASIILLVLGLSFLGEGLEKRRRALA